MSALSSEVYATSEPAPARRYPRSKVVGGFEISNATATAWAERLSGRKLDPYSNFGTILKTISKKVEPHGARFTDVGEEAGVNFMIITRVARFAGYKDMDPKLIPQFKENERETAARKLLEAEGMYYVVFSYRQYIYVPNSPHSGILDYAFKTVLC